MPTESGLRARRVGTAIRARITELLARDVSDPTLLGVVITDVELPDDLGIAWVKIRLLIGGEDTRRRQVALKSLGHAANRLRRGLGASLRLKRMPQLRFVYDTGADAASRVEVLLAEIDQDNKRK